mgnify:FL=1
MLFRSLCLDVKVLDDKGEEVKLMESQDYGNTNINKLISDDSRDYAFEKKENFEQHGFTHQEINSDTGEIENVSSDQDEDGDDGDFELDPQKLASELTGMSDDED